MKGIICDYKSFAPGKIVYSEEELAETIKTETKSIEKVRQLKSKFFDYKDGKSSYRIAEFIVELTKLNK